MPCTHRAITRQVSGSLGDCELTHLPRVPIDVARARTQHAAYEECLARLGCEVIRLPEIADLPDAVFVEDTAIVLRELAILARPGAVSRRSECESIGAALRPFRDIVAVEPPGTLDGGDVLVMGRRIYVGRSGRTNAAAIEQVRCWTEPLGYRVISVDVLGCLHLKSAVTGVADDVVLMSKDWVDPSRFAPLEILCVDPLEPHAANALWIGDRVLFPSTHPRTAARLEQRGIELERVDLSELAKAEGAVTCCSLVFT